MRMYVAIWHKKSHFYLEYHYWGNHIYIAIADDIIPYLALLSFIVDFVCTLYV